MTDETERARLAGALLNNPLLDESFVVLKEGYVQALMACKPDEDLLRWRYTAAIRNLASVRNHLGAVLQRGQIGQAQIKELAEIEEKPSVWERAKRGLWSDDASTEKAVV